MVHTRPKLDLAIVASACDQFLVARNDHRANNVRVTGVDGLKQAQVGPTPHSDGVVRILFASADQITTWELRERENAFMSFENGRPMSFAVDRIDDFNGTILKSNRQWRSRVK